MPRLTPSNLRRMPVSQVIDLLEERLRRRIPLELQLEISILLGAGDEGVRVVDPSPGGEPPFIQRLDFEKLAALLNSGLTSEKTPGANPPSPGDLLTLLGEARTSGPASFPLKFLLPLREAAPPRPGSKCVRLRPRPGAAAESPGGFRIYPAMKESMP